MSVAWMDPLTMIGYDESASNDAKLEGPGRGIWPHAMLRMVSTSVGVINMGKKLTLFVGQDWVDRGKGGRPCRGKEVETQAIWVGIGGQGGCGYRVWRGGRHGRAPVER